MSDSGRDWGASSDESIRTFNALKRESKMKHTIEQLDELHAATTQGEWFVDDRNARTDIVFVANFFKTFDKDYSEDANAKWSIEIHNAWPAISEELKRLRAWKQEAVEVLAKWSKCHEAAGSPAKLGEFESEATEREILRLQGENKLLKLKSTK